MLTEPFADNASGRIFPFASFDCTSVHLDCALILCCLLKGRGRSEEFGVPAACLVIVIEECQDAEEAKD